VARYNHPETSKTYAAAQRWVDAALKSDDSLFTPGSRIWTPEVIGDLWERFVNHPDLSTDKFLIKFERQLAADERADPTTIQLAGELLFIHFLITSEVSGERKREVINMVLSWSPEPVSIPPDLASTLDVGIGGGGARFNIARPYYLGYIVEFVRNWKGLPEARRSQALRDPWAFKDLAYEIPGERAAGQREALMHLVHPDSFERIISPGHKDLIAECFGGRIVEPDDDRDKLLLQIRRQLEDEYGADLDFYDTEAVQELLSDGIEEGPKTTSDDRGVSVGTRSHDGDVYTFIGSRGYRFPDWIVTDYLISLATKPLVLLCGISGTGKTKLAQLVAEFVAPQTVLSVMDAPELQLADTEFVLTLTIKALDHISFAIPARVAPLLPWPQKGTGYDIDVALDSQTITAHVNNMGYNAQGKATGLNLAFGKDLRNWLEDNSVQAGDRVRVTVHEGEPPTLRAKLVRAARTQVKTSSAHIAFISVRPDWTDNRALLGYLNPLTGQYSPTELLRLLLRARQHPDEPHFAILDEMNLAKVEYYFSDFLSAMESGTEMVLHDSTDEVTVELDGTQVTVPRRLQIPRNVFFTGTVNVDETTYMFSPKVLDRANVIEFHNVDLRSYAAGATATGDSSFRLAESEDLSALLKHPGGAYEWARPSDFDALSSSAKGRLLGIHDRLAQHNLHFGYRVANEVARFMNLVDTHLGPDVETEALDLQLLQKVLPKLAGNAARLEQPLLDLYADIAQAEHPAAPGDDCNLPRTAAKIGRMLEALHAVGFASFVE